MTLNHVPCLTLYALICIHVRGLVKEYVKSFKAAASADEGLIPVNNRLAKDVPFLCHTLNLNFHITIYQNPFADPKKLLNSLRKLSIKSETTKNDQNRPFYSRILSDLALDW